jgi:hypothetical protein
MKRLVAPCAAGSIPPLQVLTTALKKARDTGSVNAAADSLFFKF